MTESDKLRNGGISIRAVHLAMIILAVAAALVLVFFSYQSSSAFSKLSAATSNYIVRQKAAHDLMEGSDYLTEMVQRFTLDGDPTYMDNYFEEAFVSKRREASITAMSENHADQGLLEQLQTALNESQSLMYREYYAMKLVVEARGIQKYPDVLRTIELSDEDAMLAPEAKMELAQSMVMGEEYYSRKETIRNGLKTALELLDKQMYNTRQEVSAQVTRELNMVRWAVVVLMVLLLAVIWLSAQLGTIPLMKAAEKAKKGEPVPVIGAKEFRFMARSYNELHDKAHPAGESGGEA